MDCFEKGSSLTGLAIFSDECWIRRWGDVNKLSGVREGGGCDSERLETTKSVTALKLLRTPTPLPTVQIPRPPSSPTRSSDPLPYLKDKTHGSPAARHRYTPSCS